MILGLYVDFRVVLLTLGLFVDLTAIFASAGAGQRVDPTFIGLRRPQLQPDGGPTPGFDP